MSKPKEPAKRGRPSAFDVSLGNSVPGKYSFPAPIWALLKDPMVKALLNKMALNQKFKAKVFKLVAPTETTPAEPPQ